MANDVEQTVDQLNEEADIAADYLEGLLDIADYDGDIEMGVRNHRANVQIVADDDVDISNLVGENGEVVEALQLLTRLAVQQKTGDRSRLILDVDGFLKKRRKRLREIALDAIDEAQETGEPVDLDPMNSFERKVIHDLVREEGMKSRSHGEEPNRHITIYARPVKNVESYSGDIDDAEDSGEDFPLEQELTGRDTAPRSRRYEDEAFAEDEFASAAADDIDAVANDDSADID